MLINVNKLGWFDYIILITGSIVIIKLLSELKFSTINAEIFFNVWMQLPQMAFAFILFKFKKSSGLFLLKITLLLLMLFGLGYLMDVIYFSKDAQGAIAIIMLPFIQYFVMSIVLIYISMHKE